jgi:hypothetical protein
MEPRTSTCWGTRLPTSTPCSRFGVQGGAPLGVVLLVHRFVKIRWVQVIMLALLAFPFLLILYGLARSA